MSTTDIIKAISNIKDKEDLVSILVLCSQMVDVDTISEMARKENKTPRGIKISNKYRKIQIGKQTLVIKGMDDTSMPF
tara:strand:+ start:43 stop:276 length:234 start_codon:yes stop_codon:yes gene_type:complete